MATTFAVIPCFPATGGTGYDQFTETVTLSGVQYVMTFTWRSRLQAWYVDISDVTGSPLVLGTHVTPLWSPWVDLQVEGMPTGTVFVVGPDPYRENDLGSTVFQMYATGLSPVDTNPYGLRVVLS